jgi:teichuronic acid biosynthesis glycosyltransferase TuaH
MGTWAVVLVGGVPVEGPRALGDWQLARALAERREVLYVDPPLHPRTVLRTRSLRGATLATRRVGRGLRAIQPVVTPGANRNWGVRLGDRLIGAQVERAAKFSTGSRVIVTFEPRRGALPSVRRDLLVYWRRDQLASSEVAARPELLKRRDLELMRTADLVTGVSPPLVEEATMHGAVSELVPNGCDAEHFGAPTTPPGDFPRRDGPIIGFAGGVSWRLDVELLDHLATSRPSWTILLVGEGSRSLPDRPNVVRVGARPYAELPRWVQRFDVGVIPYRQDRFNLAAAPLKVYEYLAAGVPVVSSPLPAVTPVPGLVAACGDPRSFVAAVDDALARPPDPEVCRELARRNDWRSRAGQLEGLIEARLAERMGSAAQSIDSPVSDQ